MEDLRTPTEVVVMVVILLAYGCPIQAIVHAYGLDERTVVDWQKRAGKHCQEVHQAIVEQGKVDTHHIQADEIRAKGRKMVAWMGLAIDATSRLWMAGVVPRISRSFIATGSCLLSIRASASGLYRRLECVSKEYYARISRESEKEGRTRKSVFRSVAKPLYCDRDQAHEKETGGGSDTQDHMGDD